jgi:hypothetical protein
VLFFVQPRRGAKVTNGYGEHDFLAARVHPTVEMKHHGLAQAVHKSQGAILTALINKATLEDLPASWRQSADAEH